MKIFPAFVIWPGKEFKSQHAENGTAVSATFLPVGKEDKEESRVKVNVRRLGTKSGKERAAALKKLKRGDIAILGIAGWKDGKPYFDICEFVRCQAPVVNLPPTLPRPALSRGSRLDHIEEPPMPRQSKYEPLY